MLIYLWLGALTAGLAIDAALIWRKLRGLANSLGIVFEDYDATIAAMKEDAASLDDALAELSAEVEAIKQNPLGPPVDAEEEEDSDGIPD